MCCIARTRNIPFCFCSSGERRMGGREGGARRNCPGVTNAIYRETSKLGQIGQDAFGIEFGNNRYHRPRRPPRVRSPSSGGASYKRKKRNALILFFFLFLFLFFFLLLPLRISNNSRVIYISTCSLRVVDLRTIVDSHKVANAASWGRKREKEEDSALPREIRL